jgi:transcriptional regulator with AAA-type ATPase domain/tetratricopeptide (TPR) repeat protein
MAPLVGLLGDSPGIAAARAQLGRLLHRPAAGARRLPPLLILGETGTGKGLVAELVHRAGPRATGPFIDVNCAAIPESLLEAELFGFERGAFTDARQAKAGLFQAAHQGTLFLDEIGLMPEGLQAKLLKVIEEQRVRRLGSTRAEPIDVWLMAATSEDLEAAVRARRFREDLYHRLAVVPVRLPPLRERGDDVTGLAEHFLARACADYGLTPRTLGPEARQALRAYPWPGNVRELANAMERVALLSDARVVTAEALGLRAPAGAGTPADPDAERTRLLDALRAEDWNLSRAARRLGVPRNTLRYRMERLELDAERERIAAPAAHPLLESRPAAGAPGAGPAPRPVLPPGGVRWERRRVTLLRVALEAGSGGPTGTDARRAMESILDKVRSFGGEIDEVSAGGVVAAFGLTPVEDAPRRAAHAAIAIRLAAARARATDPARPAVRLGLHTDMLLVGRLDEGVRLDADSRRAAHAVLDALLARAEPGAAAASAGTAVFLARRFELTPLADTADGPAYRLDGHAEASQSPIHLVGRAPERQLLGERLAQAEAGHGQIVSLVGEPGIGKSRLARELRREAGARVGWLEGRAVSFGGSSPLHPLIDLVRRACRIDEGDAEPAVVAKLEAGVAALGEDLAATLPALRYLLSVDPGDPALLARDPKLRRAELFDALRRLVLAAAERRALVVVLEDLHWADPATGEWLALLADSLATRRILLVLTHRPGHVLPFADRTFHTRLALGALSAGDSAEMARALLVVEALPDALRQLVAARAEGNPFVIEEVVRSLQEGGLVRRVGARLELTRRLDEAAVPATVQDLVLARIDRLDEAARAALEVAAVIGRDFPGRLFERVAGLPGRAEPALRELMAAELIHEHGLPPEPAYTFRHALTQEVAYGSLPTARRRELHATIGRALETLHAGRLAEHCQVLAHHFARAEAWPEALGYLLQAADKAARAFATREALALYDEALEVARRPASGADRGAIAAILGAKSALHFVVSEFDRSRGEAERRLGLAREAADPALEATALAQIAWAKTWERDLPGAVGAAETAIAVAGAAGSPPVLARAHFTIGWIRAVTGHLDAADASLGRALAACGPDRDPVHRSLALAASGLVRNWAGDFAAAARLQAEALALARQHELLVPLLFGLFLSGLTLTGKGDYASALATFHEGLTLADRVGDEAIHHRLLNCLGWLHAELGDHPRALELNRQSEAIGRQRNDPGTFPNAALNLGETLLAVGDLDAARDRLEETRRYAQAPTTSEWMRFRYSIRLAVGLGELALARGEPDRARAHAAQAIEQATRIGARKNLVKAWRLTGAIATAERRWEEAAAALGEALALAEALGNPPQLWKTHATLAALHQACGRPDAARLARDQADAVVARAQAGLTDPRLRDSLAAIRGQWRP